MNETEGKAAAVGTAATSTAAQKAERKEQNQLPDF